jgi:hypothetical protein
MTNEKRIAHSIMSMIPITMPICLTLVSTLLGLFINVALCDTSKDYSDDPEDDAKEENANDAANHRRSCHKRILMVIASGTASICIWCRLVYGRCGRGQ